MIRYNCICEKRFRLKEEIDMNCCPRIVHASGSVEFCFGDLCEIGYAEVLTESTGRYTQKECWKYTGPNTIVSTWHGEMKTGDKTEWIEVDYS